jgi:protein-tyrosine phosphatase
MAEYVLKDMVRKRGIEDRFVIDSAATSREEIGNPVYPPARRKLAEKGVPCGGHRAWQMTKRDYDDFDMIICMDYNNIRNIKRITGGDPDSKISMLLDYTDRAGNEVADPWYTGNFDATWRDVVDGCEGLLETLLRTEKTNDKRCNEKENI